MKKFALFIFLVSLFLTVFCETALGYESKALILVDEIYFPGESSPQVTLENLMGHFGLPYDVMLVDSYSAGDIDQYRATFYLGTVFDRELPAVFLEDVLASNSRVVWVNYNLWKLGWDYQAEFESRFGVRYDQIVDTYDMVAFGERTYPRSQVGSSRVFILDPIKAQALASLTDGIETSPYIVKSDNFYFVADDPLSQYAEDSPYLVFSEVLHDMVGINHPENHRALVRIEDIDATEDPARIRAIADYLYSQNVPFGLAVIPRFRDPLGAWWPPLTQFDLADRPELISALDYAETKGGTVIMHGFTHQYDEVANPTNGVTGIDSEFYIQQIVGGDIINIGPVPEDSVEWVQGRIDGGLSVLNAAGFARPQIWETPHYLASEPDYQVFSDNFSILYERSADTYFPFVINRNIYGSVYIPENLGYIAPGAIEPQDIISRADKNLAIRDGFASFFFHSELDIGYLQETVAGIKALGYTFVDVDSLICSGERPDLSLSLTGSYWATYADYESRTLSVDFDLSNYTGPDALNAEVVGSVNTNSVAYLSAQPPAVDVPTAGSADLTLHYTVPQGVTFFNTAIFVEAQDSCGNLFLYPGPFPGP